MGFTTAADRQRPEAAGAPSELVCVLAKSINQSNLFATKKNTMQHKKTKQNKVPTITGLLVVDRADDELFEKVLGIRQSISYYVLRNILPNKTVPSWDLGRTAIHESLS